MVCIDCNRMRRNILLPLGIIKPSCRLIQAILLKRGRFIYGPSNDEHILTRLLRTLVYVMFNYTSRKTWISMQLQKPRLTYVNGMLRRLVLQGGLLPIAFVVMYSHLAVFFIAVTAVIIIVIYIHHSSYSLAVLVYRTTTQVRSQYYALASLSTQCKTSPRECAAGAFYVLEQHESLPSSYLAARQGHTQDVVRDNTQTSQCCSSSKLILARRVSRNRNFQKNKRNSLINVYSQKATQCISQLQNAFVLYIFYTSFH